jgi:Zn-dependent protease
MIQIRCPNCQSLLAFEDGWAASVVACPDCDTQFHVPDRESAGWPAPKGSVEPIELDAAEGAISPQDEEVLAELERLQNQQPGWWWALALLSISLLLFMGTARVPQISDSIFILIPVLAFHELGHYVAMRGFGYRNLRMFFIPFLGAAVSGQNYNVAGWKKAMVALAGPLPGIMLGVLVGVIGLISSEPKVLDIAMFLLILNGLNLLPLLPLDGGWVVHAVLFVRSPVLDVVFRVGAALTLLGLAILLAGSCLAGVAIYMLLATPMAFRLARIAHRLGQEGLVARSLDNQSIPAEAALRILAELRRALPPQTPPEALARHVANVFEAFNAEPPGVPASLGLLLLHAGGFVLALVMSVLITVLQHRLG